MECVCHHLYKCDRPSPLVTGCVSEGRLNLFHGEQRALFSPASKDLVSLHY